MIFCGDMSIPNSECGAILKDSIEATGIFSNQTVIVNLEGVIRNPIPSSCFWKVYNDISSVDLKNSVEQLIYSLGNNHTYDFPDSIKATCSILNNSGIGYCGLLENEAINPYEFTSKGESFAIFGHCWEIYTRTNTNNMTSDKVLSCSYQEFYDSVIGYVNLHPDIKVICFMHWNFDMEILPLPVYKKLSRDLIDNGVWTVIGNHSHCMQEWEIYRGRMIAYGLGNFYMPDGYYFNGSLSFPKDSHKSYAVEVDECTGHCVIHYFDNPPGQGVLLLNSVPIDCCDTATEIDYEYYKRHRSKKRLVPVFVDYQDSVSNSMKTSFLVAKIKSVRILKQIIDRIR